MPLHVGLNKRSDVRLDVTEALLAGSLRSYNQSAKQTRLKVFKKQ